MIRRFQTVCLLLALSAVGLGAEFEYGPRPSDCLLDAAEVLSPEQRKEISTPLVDHFNKEGVDVVVVVLPSLEGAPPEHVARQFADAWCESPLHAVVLHVPGEEYSPWIVPHGELVDEVRLELATQAIAEAKKRAMREPDDASIVAAAAVEASDMLRYWQANYINRTEVHKTELLKMRLELERRWYNKKLFKILGAAAVVPLVFGLSWITFGIRRKKTMLFPELKPPRRLGAPHAGGNHAEVDLGRPVPKP